MRGEERVGEGARESKGPGFVRNIDEFCRGVGIHGRISGGGGCRVKLVNSARGGDKSRGVRGVSRCCCGGRVGGAV